ncbi:DNA polymerase B region protein [Pseudomonas phage PIP]|nr:DNA polymerase B region protein [Pseudomonas phage PIP]
MDFPFRCVSGQDCSNCLEDHSTNRASARTRTPTCSIGSTKRYNHRHTPVTCNPAPRPYSARWDQVQARRSRIILGQLPPPKGGSNAHRRDPCELRPVPAGIRRTLRFPVLMVDGTDCYASNGTVGCYSVSGCYRTISSPHFGSLATDKQYFGIMRWASRRRNCAGIGTPRYVGFNSLSCEHRSHSLHLRVKPNALLSTRWTRSFLEVGAVSVSVEQYKMEDVGLILSISVG